MTVCGDDFSDGDVVLFNKLENGIDIVTGVDHNAFAGFITGEDVTVDFEWTDNSRCKDHWNSFEQIDGVVEQIQPICFADCVNVFGSGGLIRCMV